MNLVQRIANASRRSDVTIAGLREQLAVQKGDYIPYLVWERFLLRAVNGQTAEHRLWVAVIVRAIDDAHFDEAACDKRQAELMERASKAKEKGKHAKYLELRNEARATPSATLDKARESRRFLLSCDNVLDMIGIEPDWFRYVLKQHTGWAGEVQNEP